MYAIVLTGGKQYQVQEGDLVQVEKLEAEYKLTLDKQKQDKKKQNLALEEKYGNDIYKQEIQEKQYTYLKNYFESLEPKYALSVF